MTVSVNFQFNKDDYDTLLSTVEGDTAKLGQLLCDAMSIYLEILRQSAKGFTELQLHDPTTKDWVEITEQPWKIRNSFMENAQ